MLRLVEEAGQSLRPNPDAPVIGLEDFAEFIQTSRSLMHFHATSAGKSWEEAMEMNFPLMGTLAGMGALRVVGARVRGDLVGYSVFYLTLDFVKVRLVAPIIFLFALPEWPLLGLRLVRATIREAKALGASQVWISQTRESGFSWRMDILAKRVRMKLLSITYSVEM